MTLKAETGDQVAAGITYEDKPEGPIAAAIIAGGIGSLALGFFTVLAEASKGAKDALNLYDPVGPPRRQDGLRRRDLAALVGCPALHLPRQAPGDS